LAGKTASLPIQKWAAKQRCCRFRNQQTKTVSVPIQKSTAKNFVATDSEISSENCVAANSEIDS